MKRWFWAAMLAGLITAWAMPASAGLFEDVIGKSPKKKAEAQAAASARKFKFFVYLTTGDVLKAMEYKGAAKKGNFRFISNFESDIEVKTSYLKYIDMDLIGDQVLDEEYASAKADRVYLRNQDYVTGKVVSFGAKDIQVATTYGDLKVDALQVRYIMFRNPVTSVESPMRATPAKAAEAAPAKAPESEEK